MPSPSRGPVGPLALALGFAAGLALAGPGQAEPVYPAGSAVGLEPPSGMSPSTRFSGFEDRERGASIVVVEMPAEAYAEIEGRFTAEGLAPTGVAVGERRELAVPGGRAILVRGAQRAGGITFTKWIILAGAPNRTALVTAQVPEGVRIVYTDDAIEASLRTLAFRTPPGTDERLAALPFRIGDRAGFRVVQVLAGSAVALTEGPKEVDPDAAQPSVIVASGFDGAPPEADRAAFALRALRSLAQIRNLKVVGQRSIEADGAAWDEIEAEAANASNGAPLRVLQVIRFGPGGYVRTIGMVPAAQAAVLERVRRVARSVVPR